MEVGTIYAPAKRSINAESLTPGFIDPYTRRRPDLLGDGAATPSSWLGVSTVVMGNCCVGIAPWRPEIWEVATRDLVNAEAIPFAVLTAGIAWDRESGEPYFPGRDRAVRLVTAWQVSHGGHDIPVPDIERRFLRSLENLFGAYALLVDRTVCLLNSSESPEIVFTQQGERRDVKLPAVMQLLQGWRRR